MKTLLTYFSLLLTFLFCSCHNDYEIVRVKDGDTIVLDNKETVRLFDIDAPEKTQTFGMEAKDFTTSYLLHKKVQIEKMDTDKYGRTVAKVFLEDGTYFNELLVTRGYAQISYRFCHNQKLIEEMETARKNKIGLWAKENVTPFIYRKTHKQ